MPTVRVRGVDLYYEERGSGPNLLVAHGLMGSIALSERLFGERLDAIAARGVHVVAYDARGHGRSGETRSRASYRWPALAEDMRGVIEELGLRPVTVYGGSMGAGTAIALALRHPGAVGRLILRAPPPFGDDMRAARRTFGPLAWLFQVFGPKLTARIVLASPAGREARRSGGAADLRTFLAAQHRASTPAAIRGLLFDEQLPVHRLTEIRQPALVIAHPGDPIHPVASADLLGERLADARVVMAPTQLHWEQHADELAQLVADFALAPCVVGGP